MGDKALCTSYELFDAERQGDAVRHAGSGAIFDLRSNVLRPDVLRPDGWTSAEAGGRIDHAIRITVPRSDRSYVWPARHRAGSAADSALPPMGLRLRLRLKGSDFEAVDASGLQQSADSGAAAPGAA
ncbi:hypothetical protein [Streptomyces sp. NBC_00273]|uniref:hypothetical protein n=1 Tax=Streptomyces sp. NBC_00273 TaxID=2903644 RepID=UPI002E2DF5F0|nr:hypothetical protein [Streptomyces sp. NBC_00273]